MQMILHLFCNCGKKKEQTNGCVMQKWYIMHHVFHERFHSITWLSAFQLRTRGQNIRSHIWSGGNLVSSFASFLFDFDFLPLGWCCWKKPFNEKVRTHFHPIQSDASKTITIKKHLFSFLTSCLGYDALLKFKAWKRGEVGPAKSRQSVSSPPIWGTGKQQHSCVQATKKWHCSTNGIASKMMSYPHQRVIISSTTTWHHSNDSITASCHP